MKIKCTLTILLIGFLSIQAIAQSKTTRSTLRTPVSLTKITSANYLEELLKTESSSEYIITSEHISKKSGVKHTYVRQAINGIEIYGTESSLHTDGAGKTIMAHVNFVKNISSSVKNASEAITAEQAIMSVAQKMGYSVTNLQAKESLSGSNKKGLFNDAGISSRDIPVRQMYYYRDGIGTQLVWELSVMEKNSPDWWNFRVDASDGTVIDKDNWTVECASGAALLSSDCIENPSEKSMNTKHDNVHIDRENSILAVGSYNVFPYPVESPNHGSRSVVTNPDDANASPFGWHDTDGMIGPEFTTTRGNNVLAQEDVNGDNGTGAQADGGGSLSFNFPLDFSQQPIVYQNAALTNLFYWNNIAHDVYYQYGFDEVSGNFQQNNYGNGADGNDYVLADAQDGGGRNNANFGTPPDGSNPRMQMFLYDPNIPVSLIISSPTSLAGTYTGIQAAFGPSIPTIPLVGDFALYDDNWAPDNHDACSNAVNAAALSGKIVLIRRGLCNFESKVVNAQNAGAIAVIVVNNVEGPSFVMGASNVGAVIPSMMISKADGEPIIAALQAATAVSGNLTGSSTGAVDTDSDFDNGIIVHEYAHGISNRLTGGRMNTFCLGNAEQMGEGWSDFFGLMLTIEPGDTRIDRRGVGTFVREQDPLDIGIRNAPYSTDVTINDYTYADSNNTATVSQPHGVGFVWCTMLWEMTWDLIDQYGFDPDVYYGTGGNNKAIELVMEGLKLQPCQPGFVDGRDAILAADLAINGGANQCLIWEAFARRGLGISASQGSNASRTDQTEAFDLVALSLSRPSVCFTEGTVSELGGGLSPSGGVYSGNGVTDDGNGTTFSFDTSAAGVVLGMNSITFTENCTGTSTTTDLEVTSGIPDLVCQNTTVTLDAGGNATITRADVVANLLTENTYSVDQTGTFAPIDISASGTLVNLSVDGGSAAIPIGFTFPFFGVGYTNLYIASNGYISFDSTSLNHYNDQFLPNAAVPNNIIALAWDDLNPANGTAGIIRYQVTGTAPNRIMVVEYFDVPHYDSGGTLLINVQAQLFENSGKIEIHSTRIDSDGGSMTQGIENIDGTTAYAVPGRNQAVWSLPSGSSDYVAFIPDAGNLPFNCMNPVTVSLSRSDFTCKDIGDVIVTVTADDGFGGIATCDVTVTVVGEISTFSEGVWDVAPTATRKAIIYGVFNSGLNGSGDGNIDACTCEINGIASFASGSYLKVEGNIVNNDFLVVGHGGSVVQVDDAASVVNNSIIQVTKTTPNMAAKSFMISGSPMTNDVREAVYANSYIVRSHNTGNFVPNPDVELVSGGINNWADDNGNNWLTHSGKLNPGEGYMLFPQPDGTASGAFTHFYTQSDVQGTLNNGVINFNLGYNGTQNGSPNMLANPYASAIDVEVFFDHPANSAIDVVYFWEHITPLSAGYPGYNVANFNMGDISLYSESLGAGVPSASGSATPTQFIASGQGFGVKPTAGGIAQFNNAMRVTGPNDSYRTSDPVNRDRLWIHVSNDTYGLGSTALIGFTETTSDEFIISEDVHRLPTPVSLYSELATGEELVVNALGTFEISDAFYLSFTTQVKETQDYRISIQDIDGVNLENASVYIIDSLTGSVTNLTERDYTFQSGEAVYHNRFKVVFEYSALGINDSNLDSVSLYPNPTQNTVTIVSPQAIVTSATVYDIRGRKVSEVDFSNQTTYQIDLSTVESALYFIEITTESGTVMKRVMKK